MPASISLESLVGQPNPVDILSVFFLLACVLAAQSCPTFCDPIDCSLPGSFVRGIFQARIVEWGSFFLQGIFLTQGSNPGLLHCRWMPYHLIY